jgi:hypothetical protein
MIEKTIFQNRLGTYWIVQDAQDTLDQPSRPRGFMDNAPSCHLIARQNRPQMDQYAGRRTVLPRQQENANHVR